MEFYFASEMCYYYYYYYNYNYIIIIIIIIITITDTAIVTTIIAIVFTVPVALWPKRAMASSFLKFLDHVFALIFSIF
jgi:hypothetical protein